MSAELITLLAEVNTGATVILAVVVYFQYRTISRLNNEIKEIRGMVQESRETLAALKALKDHEHTDGHPKRI